MKILTAQRVNLGFIGLGNMGSRIAQRLVPTDTNSSYSTGIVLRQKLWYQTALYP
jgi:phosphoglycerate dehydrogenase-like enzyme